MVYVVVSKMCGREWTTDRVADKLLSVRGRGGQRRMQSTFSYTDADMIVSLKS